MSTVVETLTAEEFARRHGGDHVELIDGRVVSLVPYGFTNGVVCAKVARVVGGFIDDRGAGSASCGDTFVLTRRNPDRVRGADFCFWSRARLPRPADEDFVAVPPDMVVEVRPPAGPATELAEKVVEYIGAGVRMVVVLFPRAGTATIYRHGRPAEVLGEGDTLELPDVLPGFAVPVKLFFESE